MEHPVLRAIQLAGFTPFGWFEPQVGDGVPDNAKFVILVGNAGPQMFARFARERDPDTAKIDDWTRDMVDQLAAALDAEATYPFTKPHRPFLTWARRAGAGFTSPLGLNIHPQYGLWHAFRAALLFPVAFDLPPVRPGTHPCEACAEKPCLTACPVGAFSDAGYDTELCSEHLRTSDGQPCMSRGCLARRACPVGQAYAYPPAQAQFFMTAFLATRDVQRS
jgi:epoxyqueuosine reductase QueG